jgi:curved DNA-binding protein
LNPYEILGVGKSASTEDIKKAYRKLARETHPDLNPGDSVAEARFKQVSVAYDVLSDEQKRADYDEFGDIALEGGFDAERARTEREHFSSRFGSPDGTGFGEAFAFEGLEDLFRQFGGSGGNARTHGGPSSTMRMPGRDLESEMTLGFVEAAKGGERRLSLARPAADGSAVQQSITVRIPPGVSDGGRLRIPGKGGQGIGGGPPGDLWLSLRVEPHPIFRRVGHNLELDLPITLKEASLGAKIEIPTLDQSATLTIPPATSSHARLRLKGKGIPGAKGKPDGDLLVRIQIVLPKEFPEPMLEALELCEQEDPRKGLFR